MNKADAHTLDVARGRAGSLAALRERVRLFNSIGDRPLIVSPDELSCLLDIAEAADTLRVMKRPLGGGGLVWERLAATLSQFGLGGADV